MQNRNLIFVLTFVLMLGGFGAAAAQVTCPDSEAVSIDDDGMALVPDIPRHPDFDPGVEGNLIYDQSPPVGSPLSALGDYPVDVLVQDEDGNFIGECQTLLSVVDTTPPLVTLAVGVPNEGLPAYQAPLYSLDATDNSGEEATLTLLLDGFAYVGEEIDPGLMTPGVHCLQGSATDSSGNESLTAASCFQSRETVYHDAQVTLLDYTCIPSETGVFLDAVLAIEPVPGESGQTAFNPLDIAPTTVLLEPLSEDGIQLNTQALLPEGSTSADDFVWGAVANDQLAVFTFTVEPDEPGDVPTVYRCPESLAISGMAISKGWLVSFEGETIDLVPQNPGGCNDPGCGNPGESLPRDPGCDGGLQPATDQVNEPPTTYADTSTCEVGQCSCHLVTKHKRKSDDDSDNPAGNSCQSASASVKAVGAIISGSGKAVDDIRIYICTGNGSASASTSANERLRGTIVCTPRPCPDCCTPPRIECDNETSFTLRAELNPPGSATIAGRMDVTGCGALSNSGGVTSGAPGATYTLGGGVKIGPKGPEVGVQGSVTLSGVSSGPTQRTYAKEGFEAKSECMGLIIAGGSISTDVLADADVWNWYAEAKTEVKESKETLKIEGFCAGSSVGSLSVH